jgi:hypothetical protein
MLGAYDFSMNATWVNGLLSLLSIMALMCIFTTWTNNKSIFDVLVALLFLQTFFIILMLVNHGFSDFVQSYIRNDSQLERMAGYGGVRGLGISGSIAFGLSTVMGFLGLCLHYWFAFERQKTPSFIKYLLFLLCLIASLSAGRTAVLGFVLGFIFYFVSYGVVNTSIYFVKYIFTSILVTYLLYLLVITDEQTLEILTRYSNYAFQSVFNYIETGSFATTSTIGLQNMYFYPPNGNLLFGDGFYSGENGSYYLNVDAGYMRFLLNFGVLGSLFIYGSFTLLLFKFASEFRFKGQYLLFFTIFILFSIYHYKGDVIFYNVAMMKILFMIGYYGILKSKSKSKSKSKIN